MSREPLRRIEERLDAKDYSGARAAAEAALADRSLPPTQRAAVLWLRARVAEAQGRGAEAIADMEAATGLAPRDVRLWNELGYYRTMVGDHGGAAQAFEQALVCDIANVRAWNNLGNARSAVGNLAGAAAAYAEAVARKPDYALAWANLGAARRNLGDRAGARDALQRALALDPKLATALGAFAALHRDEANLDAAIQLYARAAQADPRDAAPCLQLASALAERDDLDASRQVYAEAGRRDPTNIRALIGERLTLPMVHADAAAIVAARQGFARGLAELEALLPGHVGPLAPAKVLDGFVWSNFLLAYCGEDDRDLQVRYANLVGTMLDLGMPGTRGSLPRRDRQGRKVRVGFLSAFFRDGTVGRYFERWLTDLDRDRFEVVVYHLQPGSDALAQRIAGRADTFREMPRWPPSRIAPVVRGDALDVLVYPELGMDATTFALAALRLAPRQCAAWGHPVTTGHATIDVFISVDAMEPAGADEHYSERLVRLPGIGTCYARPAVPANATRAAFGLPEGVPLLLCPQSLFKIHPDDDALFARVLARISDARLVLFEGRHPRITAEYLDRLGRTLRSAGVDPAGRMHVLAQCGHEDYLRINTVCDAMLDTTRWSGGNTSLDALACCLPVVTLPGRFMRGRQSAAILGLAGVGELVARDTGHYVDIAERLVRDASWRATVRERMRAGHVHVFADAGPLRAFADFLLDTTTNG